MPHVYKGTYCAARCCGGFYGDGAVKTVCAVSGIVSCEGRHNIEVCKHCTGVFSAFLIIERRGIFAVV